MASVNLRDLRSVTVATIWDLYLILYYSQINRVAFWYVTNTYQLWRQAMKMFWAT